jgi:hypothetical protein
MLRYFVVFDPRNRVGSSRANSWMGIFMQARGERLERFGCTKPAQRPDRSPTDSELLVFRGVLKLLEKRCDVTATFELGDADDPIRCGVSPIQRRPLPPTTAPTQAIAALICDRCLSNRPSRCPSMRRDIDQTHQSVSDTLVHRSSSGPCCRSRCTDGRARRQSRETWARRGSSVIRHRRPFSSLTVGRNNRPRPLPPQE